ncbi:MAG: inosose dehydratase [Mycetocola sp.]|nr:inosose dehydratase [Mycetocola sp.]
MTPAVWLRLLTAEGRPRGPGLSDEVLRVGVVRCEVETYTDAVREGIYVPLGTGDVDVASIVAVLTEVGYDGWYVLEQDTILSEMPADDGPVRDVAASLDCLRSLSPH